MPRHNQSYNSYVAVFDACSTECRRCAEAALKSSKVTHFVRVIKLSTDCALLCSLVVAFIKTDSEFLPKLSGVCAELCQACADECFTQKPPHWEPCAEACSTCADVCRKMAAVIN